MSLLKTIHDLLVTTIQGLTIADVAMNDAARVTRRRVIDPPVLPYVSVYFDRFSSEHGPSMGRYTRSPVFFIVIYATGDPDPDIRIGEAQDLADQVMTAIENIGPGNLGLNDIVNLMIDGEAFDGAEEDLDDGIAVAVLRVGVTYRKTRGA